jgi:hypothetical protein
MMMLCNHRSSWTYNRVVFKAEYSYAMDEDKYFCFPAEIIGVSTTLQNFNSRFKSVSMGIGRSQTISEGIKINQCVSKYHIF